MTEIPIPSLGSLGGKFPWAEITMGENAERKRKPPIVDPAEVEKRRQDAIEAGKLLAQDFAAVFGSARGERVLAFLRSRTLEAKMFDPNMGFFNGAAYGYAREGQNSIVQFIADMVRRGKEEG